MNDERSTPCTILYVHMYIYVKTIVSCQKKIIPPFLVQ